MLLTVGLKADPPPLGLYFFYEKIPPWVFHGDSLTLIFDLHALSPLGLCTSEPQLYWHTLLLASNTLLLAAIRHLLRLTAQTTRPLLAQEGNRSWMLDRFPADSLTMWGFDPGPAVPTYLPSLSLPVLVSVFTLLTNRTRVDFLNSGPFWTILPNANQTLYIRVGVGGKKPLLNSQTQSPSSIP